MNLQKPMCNDLQDARRMLEAAEANDRVLRVMVVRNDVPPAFVEWIER